MKNYKFKVINHRRPEYNKELTVEAYNHEHALHTALMLESPFDCTDYENDDASEILMEHYGIEFELICKDC